jgi:hypothetical protein
MKRFITLSCVLFTMTLAGCSGLYVQKDGTPQDEMQANIDAAESAKQERLK